jgi:hypothetical protein
MPSETIGAGVHEKLFVRDETGIAWLIKSGALNEPYKATHTKAEEISRRAAFPVHEVIVPLLLAKCGVLVNEVGLGFRTMDIPVHRERARLLVSIHRMQPARRRDQIVPFKPTDLFIEDLFAMLCENVVVGQRDHELHNYMVTPNDRLLAVDNGDCMKGDWIDKEAQSSDFDAITSKEEARLSWTAELRRAVKCRLEPLTVQIADAAFAALPAEGVAWHDSALGSGYYLTGTVALKQIRVSRNLEAMRRWAGF